MAAFTKNRQTGRFDVIGTVNEMNSNTVTVTKKDGTKKTVAIYGRSKTFVAKFGPLEGKQCVIAKVGRLNYSGDDGGDYCGGICPVSGLRCCKKNGPCHDCM